MEEEELLEDLEDIILYIQDGMIHTAIRILKSLRDDIKRYGID
jgi:hypothetical protein